MSERSIGAAWGERDAVEGRGEFVAGPGMEARVRGAVVEGEDEVELEVEVGCKCSQV